MNEIAHACSIGSVVVTSEDCDVGSLSDDDLLNDGKEVCGSVADRVVAEDACVVIACGVEVSQGNDFPVGVGASNRPQHHVDNQFCLTVGTDRDTMEVLSAVVLFAVHCGRGRKNELFTGGKEFHHLHQVYRPNDVIFVVFKRNAHGIGGRLQCCKVNDSCDGPSLLLTSLKYSL